MPSLATRRHARGKSASVKLNHVHRNLTTVIHNHDTPWRVPERPRHLAASGVDPPSCSPSDERGAAACVGPAPVLAMITENDGRIGGR
jgi:hypothetical protein